MTWSFDEVNSFITMCITIPTFILALCGVIKCHKRWRTKRLQVDQSIEMADAQVPLLPPSQALLQSPPISPLEHGDVERGWIQYNHVTTSISRSGTFRVEQSPRHFM
ncbi:hypothetical protein BJX99DRAFT_237943 [Aspergillus californicus]